MTEMNQTTQPIKESIFSVNLNELAHSLLRDLAMACKKVSIYGSGHPSAVRAIERPFLILDEILNFKKYVNFNLQNGYLFILNIRLNDSVFNQEIIKYMQLSDVNAILFKRQMTMAELGKFVDRFVRRVDLSNHANQLSSFLKNNDVRTIEVNSEEGYWLFEECKQYRGDVDIDFSVKNIILQLLPNDLEILADLSQGDEEYGSTPGLDYDSALVRYLIPEKTASLPADSIINKLIELFSEIKANENHPEREGLLERSLAIYRLVDYHPDRKRIIEKLNDYFTGGSIPRDIFEEYESPTGKIKLESRERIDAIIDETFGPGSKRHETGCFSNAFSRLLKTGQKDKAIEVTEHLVELLGAADAGFRQESLNLLVDAIRPLNLLTDSLMLEHLVDIAVRKLAQKKETFEYSEFIWLLYEKCRSEKKFELMSKLMTALSRRRQIENDIVVYDSMAIKKVFSNFNQPDNINKLIKAMLESDFETAGCIRGILITAGSEEVAMELSYIISHPQRQVRQQALKILGELGKASLKVFSQILVDDSMFERDKDRHELPDDKWYIIRNSIFVLGLLKDTAATTPLRLRINDNDIRVRREIIAAMEKIGGEEACDILVMMADDPAKEIRESAVITIGLIGLQETAPLLIDLAQKNPKVVIKAINALGKLGGKEADEFLVNLLGDEDQFHKLATGEVSRDDVGLATIRALGQIGNTEAIQKIKEYKDRLSTTQKIFFKNSQINKTLEEILSRH